MESEFESLGENGEDNQIEEPSEHLKKRIHQDFDSFNDEEVCILTFEFSHQLKIFKIKNRMIHMWTMDPIRKREFE